MLKLFFSYKIIMMQVSMLSLCQIFSLFPPEQISKHTKSSSNSIIQVDLWYLYKHGYENVRYHNNNRRQKMSTCEYTGTDQATQQLPFAVSDRIKHCYSPAVRRVYSMQQPKRDYAQKNNCDVLHKVIVRV